MTPCPANCWPLYGVWVVSDDGRPHSAGPCYRCPTCGGTGKVDDIGAGSSTVEQQTHNLLELGSTPRRPTRPSPEESISVAFHRAWSACIGKLGYNKATWLAAEKQLFPGNFIEPVKPHFMCHNCGATAFAVRAFARGHLVSGVFSQEADEFKAKHENCLPIQDGGCI